MKCLISVMGVSGMERVGNEDARRTVIEWELASKADQRVLRLLAHVFNIFNK